MIMKLIITAYDIWL